MQNIKTYILEKFKISSKNISNHIDFENGDIILDIFKATFISIYKNSSYTSGASSQKKIKNINYNDIIDILNNIFKYKNITYDEGKVKTGKVWKIIYDNKKQIEYLVNKYTIHFVHYDLDLDLSGRKLYEEYKDIIMKR